MWQRKLILCVQFFFWAHNFVQADNSENSIVSATDCNVDDNEPWSYGEINGPHDWSTTFDSCSGKEQSPIAVTTSKALPASSLPKLEMNGYDTPVSVATMLNNGRTIQLIPKDGIQRSFLLNDSTFVLSQLHFHWGDSNNYGAEHMIDGFKYSMEMHLVHHNDGHELAVVAVFFHEEHKRNIELQKIIDDLPQISYKHMETHLTSDIRLDKLLPSNTASYFRYHGSLTTPGCDERVTWSLLTHAQPVGIDQMAEFRKLYSTDKTDPDHLCHMSNNFRPIQHLNNRSVFISSSH